MNASRACYAGLFLLAGPVLGQQTARARPLPGPAKDAGVYHVATGTWTRGGGQENLGSKVLYSNNAHTGFFGFMGAPADIHWTDEGRIPSTSGHPNAKANEYVVESIQLSYCSAVVTGPQTGALDFYDSYASCTVPTGATVLSMAFSVPGGGTSTACWIVTFDLKGTSLEFDVHGDADGTFDGTTALDSFGWTLHLDDLGTGGFNGPQLTGDPNNFPYGDGTYYQNPGASFGTGLDTRDQFWLADTSGTYANGCYWFGGYAGGNPLASFWLVLGGDNVLDTLGTTYCTANANSTGAPADISAIGGSAGGGNITVTSTPVPDQPGIFFHGPIQANLPFGNGVRCVAGSIVRGAVVSASGNSASYTYDNTDNKHRLTAFIGQLRHFQHWFHDPLGGGSMFNLSNAVRFVVP